MHEIERYQHELYAHTNGFKCNVERTRRVLHEALLTMKNPYIAFSGGIDSTVMLDLIFSIGACPVQWGDDGADYPETLRFLDETAMRYDFKLRRIANVKSWREWCLEMGRPDLASDLSAWLHPPMEHDAVWETWEDRILQNPGYDGVFLGMLAIESRTRRIVLENGHKMLYQVAREQGMWHCCPLASWTKRDIWAYVVSQELAYNPVYDKLAAMGVTLERRRVAPLTCFRVMQYGSVVHLRQGWPDLYMRLAALFPKVREYS
jgi:phosphoadenosine phosphosulfate reductase